MCVLLSSARVQVHDPCTTVWAELAANLYDVFTDFEQT